MSSPVEPFEQEGTSRRRFLTYLVAAPTLAVAVNYGLLPTPALALPGTPEPADNFDLGDFLILAAKPTEGMLIVLVMEPDGSVSCALPREEVGQGITTAVAMLIAEELDLPLAKVKVTLADARVELLNGQLTGGSNTIRSVYEPVRMAAASMRGSLVAAAAKQQGTPRRGLRTRDGNVVFPGGETVSYASLAEVAADPAFFTPNAAPKAAADRVLVGSPQNRIDARAMVTGQMKYTNDLDPVPGALRAMTRRPPTIRGRVVSVDNRDAVLRMAGVVAVEVIDLSVGGLGDDQSSGPRSTGVAVVAETFGQALDGKEALEVTWEAGPIDPDEDDESLRAKLEAIQLPFTPSLPVPGLGEVQGDFYWHFASHAPLESNTAIANVTKTAAEVWTGTKVPVVAQQTIEMEMGVPTTLRVIQGGGSFGRRLFFDAGLEAARISKAVGKPVKLMFTRIDDMRHGRARAASVNSVRMTHAAGEVLSMEQRVASVETDFRHGLGDVFTAAGGAQLNVPAALVPAALGGNATFAQSVFLTTVRSPYAFGATSQLLTELPALFNTASWRSVYSASARGCEEIMVDELAKAMGFDDPAAFRLSVLDDPRQQAVLSKVMELGDWGKRMPAGTAQGIAFHQEYKSMTACLVEIDARKPQDPRVTRATIAADYGLPINPRGLQAQLLGGLTDAIGITLRAGLHLKDGGFLEGSYSQFHFPRQADTPPKVDIFIFPETTGAPGGAGELGVPAAVGAVANAYARATGTQPRSFPIIFPVDFTPFPTGTGSTRVNPR